jgi:hypothetical protein
VVLAVALVDELVAELVGVVVELPRVVDADPLSQLREGAPSLAGLSRLRERFEDSDAGLLAEDGEGSRRRESVPFSVAHAA